MRFRISHLHRFPLTVKFLLARGECLNLTLSLRVIPCQYRRKLYITKNWIIWPTFLPRKLSVYFQSLLLNPPRKLPNSVKLSRCYGYYAVQGHSRSPILVIESSYASATSYWMKWNEMKWKCGDLKCVQKPTRGRLSLTHLTENSRWAWSESPCNQSGRKGKGLWRKGFARAKSWVRDEILNEKEMMQAVIVEKVKMMNCHVW